MNKRDAARNDSDFALSDTVRDHLKIMGVEVKDQKNGPSGPHPHPHPPYFYRYFTIVFVVFIKIAHTYVQRSSSSMIIVEFISTCKTTF
jgi:hypothetical protein